MMLYFIKCTQKILLHKTSWSQVRVIWRNSRIMKGQIMSTQRVLYNKSKRDRCILPKHSDVQFGHSKNILTCLCGRKYLSDMKNDDLVKSWLNEIKEDFQKEKVSKHVEKDETSKSGQKRLSSNKLSDTVNKESNKKVELNKNDRVNSNSSALSEDVSAVHGFTAEEIIEIVKQAQDNEATNSADADEEHSENVSESSSSDSDEDLISSSSSDSDDEVEKKTENSKQKLKNELSDKDIGLNESDVETASVKLKHELNKVVNKDEEIRSMKDRFKNASDFVKSEIEDFVNIDFEEPEEEVRTWESPVPLTRGKTGVFDLEDLIKVLEASRARDVVVIKIPEQVDFADYMVIVSALSFRHIKAISAEVKLIYKRRKHQKDNSLRIEGEDTKDWFAMDLGNIILHIFTPATREQYDLETLWTVGPQFDPKCQEEVKPQVFSLNDLPWLEAVEQSEGSTNKSVTTGEQSTSKE